MGNPVAIGLASALGNTVKQGINKGFSNIDVGEVVVSGISGFAGAGAGKLVSKVGGTIANQALYNAGKETARQVASAIALKTAVGGLGSFSADAISQGAAVAMGAQEGYNPQQGLNATVAGAIGSGVGAYAEESAKYNNFNTIQYPPNKGFDGKPNKITLETGQQFDRFGGIYGRYVTDPGTSGEMLSLPLGSKNLTHTTYTVMRPIKNVLSGTAAPWFGQPGGGAQYYLPKKIVKLIKKGVLR